MEHLSDQDFLKLCEEYTLKGINSRLVPKNMGSSQHAFYKRRRELNFTQWFYDKHGISPISASKWGLSKRKKLEAEKVRAKEITFHDALKKLIQNPNFLDAVHKKIAAKTLGV